MFVRPCKASDERETPQELFDKIDAEFHFTLDACATKENAKCSRFYTKEDNALIQEWHGVVWMNPPYSQTGVWMAKAYQESLRGATVVCLVPSATDTAWWHEYATKGEIRFLRGRVKFVGSKGNAPFPSALVIFRAGE